MAGLGDAWSARALASLRIVTALLFLQHGLNKFFDFPQTAGHHVPAMFTLVWFAGVIEIVGSVLVALGVFSRLAALVMSGEMAVAYFRVAAPHSFFPLINRGEELILFSFIFLLVAVAGPGAWAVDSRR
ncbi:MAG: DoxX family protein [Rhodospirillales bacterium]|nr:DoxX family protein [Rhodospirillales bacterium]MDE2197659.1 DoxX family protein [Rhodospirillales bacterium]MDE2574645.1 DoxX family protein [Rhodospirillales bacterium]